MLTINASAVPDRHVDDFLSTHTFDPCSTITMSAISERPRCVERLLVERSSQHAVIC